MKFTFLALCLFLSACNNFSVTESKPSCKPSLEPFGGGKGTSADPYQLCSRKHLQNIVTPYHDKFFILKDDINLGGVTTPFTPIGMGVSVFQGTLNGNSKTISNFYFHDNSQAKVGLFSEILNATIHHLRLTDADLLGLDNVGILAGTNSGNTTSGSISNIRVSGAVESATTHLGLLFGSNDAGAKISYVNASGTVTGGGNFIGGLVGWIEGGTVDHVNLNNITVTGLDHVGGLAGIATSIGTDLVSNIKITNATVSGDNNIGGLVGSHQVETTDSEFSGTVTATGSSVGGIAGVAYSAMTKVKVTGNVTAGVEFAGGITGEMDGALSQVKVTGDVTANQYAGGIAGQSYSSGTINLARYVGDIVTTTGGAGGILGQSANGMASIKKSGSSGTIIGGNRVGGIVGNSADGPYLFEDVFSDSVITVTANGAWAGGIAGSDDTGFVTTRAIFAGSFLTSGAGTLTATSGLAAFQNAPTTSYFDSTINAAPILDTNANGVTTAIFNDPTNGIYSTFNFTSVWSNTSGTYPKLKSIDF